MQRLSYQSSCFPKFNFILFSMFRNILLLLFLLISSSLQTISSLETVSHPSSLWGPTCDGLDKICEVSLPEMKVGEWLYFTDMGAYTVCAASNFNGFVKPRIYYYVTEEMK